MQHNVQCKILQKPMIDLRHETINLARPTEEKLMGAANSLSKSRKMKFEFFFVCACLIATYARLLARSASLFARKN